MCWMPVAAPMANTTACTASSATVAGEGASSSATASSTVVSDATKRGPRGSICTPVGRPVRASRVLDMG